MSASSASPSAGTSSAPATAPATAAPAPAAASGRFLFVHNGYGGPPPSLGLVKGHSFDVVQQYEIERLDWSVYDAIYLPMSTDQIHLTEISDRLEAWLDQGGTLVVNGHIARPFLTGLSRYEPMPKRGLAELQIHRENEHPAFASVTAQQLTLRKGVAGFYGRGSNPPPEGATVIHSVGPDHVAVDWLWERPAGGRVLAHAGVEWLAVLMLEGPQQGLPVIQGLFDWLAQTSGRKADAAQEAEAGRRADPAQGTPSPSPAPAPAASGSAPRAKPAKGALPGSDPQTASAPAQAALPLRQTTPPVPPQRQPGKPLVAVIDGGQHYHRDAIEREPLQGFFDSVIYLRDVPLVDLSAWDIVIVTCRLNAHALAPLARQFQGFMRQGGTLVAMGETFPETWLPDIGFVPMQTNFWWWLTPGADLGLRMSDPDHAICRHLTREDVTFHLHGAYVPLHPNQKSLVETRDGECQLFEDVTSYAPGRLVATTLDPFFHHGAFFMPATTRMLLGMLPWLIESEARRHARQTA